MTGSRGLQPHSRLKLIVAIPAGLRCLRQNSSKVALTSSGTQEKKPCAMMKSKGPQAGSKFIKSTARKSMLPSPTAKPNCRGPLLRCRDGSLREIDAGEVAFRPALRQRDEIVPRTTSDLQNLRPPGTWHFKSTHLRCHGRYRWVRQGVAHRRINLLLVKLMNHVWHYVRKSSSPPPDPRTSGPANLGRNRCRGRVAAVWRRFPRLQALHSFPPGW